VLKFFMSLIELAATLLSVACGQSDPMHDTDRLHIRWNDKKTQKPPTISDDDLTLSWDSDEQFAWLGSQTNARLADGVFTWDFHIGSITS